MRASIGLVLLLMTSCVSTDVAKSWEGANINSLIMAWGGPDRDYQLPDGGRELTYRHERFVEGTSYYCSAIFKSSASGTITLVLVDGNLGGCNRLLGSKPARN